MNLGLFIRVLSRFRYLVASGVALAMLLAIVSVVRVSFDGGAPTLEDRAQEKWQSVGTLFVTQRGFPWGRSVLDEVVPIGPEGEAGYIPKYAEGPRFQGLAMLYAELAKGDAVRQIMLRDGPIEGTYDAAPVRGEDGTSLPLIAIGGHAASPEKAEEIGGRAVEAFLTYLRETQQTNAIPVASRVQVEVVEQPKAVLVEGRSYTRPIFLFVLVTSATVMLAFALENLRPSASAAATAAAVRPARLPEAKRKTA